MAWIIAKESGMNNFNETVSEFLDEVISDYATGLNHRVSVDVDKLPCSVIKEFAAICMEDGDDEMVFITETEQSDLTHIIAAHFKKDDDDTLFDVDEYISNAAIKYYLPTLKDLLNEKLGSRNQECLIGSGFERYVDQDNGEANWVNGTRRVQL
jgi:hypothetical protein